MIPLRRLDPRPKQGASGPHRDRKPRLGGGLHRLRDARGLAAEQQHVVAVAMIKVGRRGLRREQHELQPLGFPPRLERGPRGMPPQRHLIEVVHTGAAEGPIRYRKTGRLDDVRRDAEAGAEPQNRSGILRDIGLVEGELHEALRTCRAARIEAKHRVS